MNLIRYNMCQKILSVEIVFITFMEKVQYYQKLFNS